MALRSMTGFGRAQCESDGLSLEAEVRSVNNRFLDVVCKIPSLYAAVEADVVKSIRAQLGRGRVEVFVNRRDTRDVEPEVLFHESAFKSFFAVYQKAAGIAKLKDKPDFTSQAVLDLLRKREVLESVQPVTDDSDEAELLQSVVSEAVADLVTMREREGKALEEELVRLLSVVEEKTKKIQSKAASMIPLFRERVVARLEKLELDVAVDEQRLAQEIALLADRADVTEEIARLESHCSQFRTLIKNGDGGRKLEFLLQEMGREINTVGSKCQHSELSNDVIEVKSILEKLREQVLNVE